MQLVLDRMDIEEAGGANPDRLAAAIHRQLRSQGLTTGPVPVEAIATALDIIDIRIESLSNVEGGLVTTAERGIGSILVSAAASQPRQRFTIGHELGHFLNVCHAPTGPDGFTCSKTDLRSGDDCTRKDLSRHDRQEREANRFAACLLLPDYRLIRYIDDNPDLGQVLGAARDLHCSRESVARRYSELLELPNAMLFSKDGKLRYFVRSGGIGSLDIGVGDPLRDLPPANGDTGLSDIEDMSSVGWLRYGQERDLTIQTLHQQNGYAMTLVTVSDHPDDDDGLEDTVDRLDRFGSRS
ncbi:MAG: ImmA/IrrE family metallo-endopeptidase [Brucellaceae bacterium]|nr:ImmA/IrrE family metallo-endopeptidase [Brucellaceae bacterium]